MAAEMANRQTTKQKDPNGPKSNVGAFFKDASEGYQKSAKANPVSTQQVYEAHMAMAKGGKVPAMVSPGEKYLPPQAVEAVKQGANPMKEGKTVPGKPKVGGAKNDYANDTVKAELDEGGIVLPRSVTQAKDSDKKAEQFVLAVLAKHGHKPQLKKRSK